MTELSPTGDLILALMFWSAPLVIARWPRMGLALTVLITMFLGAYSVLAVVRMEGLANIGVVSLLGALTGATLVGLFGYAYVRFLVKIGRSWKEDAPNE